MTSEWMKVMLDEIARKKFEAEQARLEEQMRNSDPTGSIPTRDIPADNEPSASAQRL